jgi:hypothetical protein
MTQKTGDTAAQQRRADFCVRNADRLRKQATRLRGRADLDDQAADKWEAEAARQSVGQDGHG